MIIATVARARAGSPVSRDLTAGGNRSLALTRALRCAPWLLLTLAVGGCVGGGATRQVLEVAETRVPCIGIAPQLCLLVRGAGADEWGLMYQGIDGFEPEPGFRYRLRVERRRIPNPPMDASSVSYRLVHIIERRPGPSAELLARVAEAEARWWSAARQSYTMVVRRGCFCVPEAVGPARLQVAREDGPVPWERIIAPIVYAESGRPVEFPFTDYFPTVGQLFGLLRIEIVSEPHAIELEFDEALGYPRRVFIDRAANVADDEVEYTVSIE